MLIRVWIERTQPLAGTAAIEGGDLIRFRGWLELLRVLSELVVARSGEDVATRGSPVPGNEPGSERKEVSSMIGGVAQVVIEVEDQERAKAFWVETLGFELAQDAPYGAERWLEVRTPDKSVVVVLELRKGPRPTPPSPGLPTSNVSFYAEDLQQAYQELRACGVTFPQPPVEQPFGWWSLFEDPDGNRFALVPRGQ
jgi:predicted enzyme related to lactoylglutathione lyase